MNNIDKIRNAYTEAMKALESGYSHKVKDAITNLITIFEQEYPERTQVTVYFSILFTKK